MIKGTPRNRALGDLGERLACEALTKRGYVIVERNWRCTAGELDIVAREGAVWVFVEIKTRRGHNTGLPEDGLTPQKAERLVRSAEAYLTAHELYEVDWRIDFVGIELDGRDAIKRLNIIPGAVVE